MTPSISVITVVYNSRELLRGTIESVKAQTLKDLEYVVIDGGSKDGTKELVAVYDEYVDVFVSEPDHGIFDAMNKGLKLAKGSFILFLNAGDHLASPIVLENAMKLVNNGIDVVYGETEMVDNNRSVLGLRSNLTPHRLPDDLTWRAVRFGLCVSHQSFIVRKSITSPYIESNISADIDWVIKCLKRSKGTIKAEFIISQFLVGGFSKQNRLRSWFDRYKILRNHFGLIPNIINHFLIALRALAHAVGIKSGT